MATESQIRKVNGFNRTTYWAVDVQDKYVTNPDGSSRLIPGSGHYITDETPSVYTARSTVRNSVKTPLYNSPKRPVPLPNNGFSYTLEERTSGGYWNRWNRIPPNGVNNIIDTRVVWENSNVGYPLPAVDFAFRSAKLRDQVNTAILLKLKNMSINVAQATAERKMTSDLVAKTATRLAKAFKSIKRGDLVGAGKALDVIPSKRSATRLGRAKASADQAGNYWLELQYGWKPLLNDVYGAAEALANAQNNRIFGAVKSQKTYSESATDRINALGSAKGVNEWTTVLNARITVKCGLLYEKSSPPVAQLSSLGITNPALIAWELMPYSFVIDWFLPIGNWLSSLDATLGLTFHSGYTTTFFESYASATKSEAFTSGSYVQVGYGRETYRKVTVTRTALLGFPSAPLPRFKNPLSTSHVASAMALLLQTFKR